MPNEPSRHHYVPESYLRGWLDPTSGQLWRCVRTPVGALHDKAVSPKSTGFEWDLYKFSDATPLLPVAEPNFVEKDFFRKIDNDGALALATLRDVGIGGLDESGRDAWAIFLNALLERRPDRLALMEQRARAVADRTFHALQTGSEPDDRERFARLLTEGVRGGMSRNFVRQQMMERISKTSAIEQIKRGRWVVVKNFNPEFEFITTDAPVVLNYGTTQSSLQVLGIALTPEKLFFVYPQEWADDAESREALGLMAFVHNVLLLDAPCTYIYSRTELTDGDTIYLRRAADLWLGRPERLRDALGLSPEPARQP